MARGLECFKLGDLGSGFPEKVGSGGEGGGGVLLGWCS